MSIKPPIIITASFLILLVVGLLFLITGQKRQENKLASARDEASQDFAKIEVALEKYYQANNEYPNTIENIGVEEGYTISLADLGLSQDDTLNSYGLDYSYGAQGLYSGGLRCKYYFTMHRSSTFGDTSIIEFEKNNYKCSQSEELNVPAEVKIPVKQR